MPDITILQTSKFLKMGAAAIALVVVALEIGCILSWNSAVGSSLIMIAPLLLLVWPAMRAIERRYTRAVISGDRLRYETGMASRSTRTIQLSKVQDVKVDQSLWQRIFNVGDLSFETAGETSRLSIPNLDSPQALADEIMNRAQHTAGV